MSSLVESAQTFLFRLLSWDLHPTGLDLGPLAATLWLWELSTQFTPPPDTLLIRDKPNKTIKIWIKMQLFSVGEVSGASFMSPWLMEWGRDVLGGQVEVKFSFRA